MKAEIKMSLFFFFVSVFSLRECELEVFDEEKTEALLMLIKPESFEG